MVDEDVDNVRVDPCVCKLSLSLLCRIYERILLILIEKKIFSKRK